MTLIAEAELAEDIGDALGKFKIPVEDQAAEVTALVSKLYAVGSALREIDTASNSLDYGRNLRYIQDDLDLVRASLKYTLEDVFRILGKIGNGDRILTESAYRQTWRDITNHFQRVGGGRLSSRLETYRLFLLALYSRLRRFSDPSSFLLKFTQKNTNKHAEAVRSRFNMWACDAKSVVYLRTTIAAQTISLLQLADCPWSLQVFIYCLSGLIILISVVSINRPRSYERERPLNSPTSSHDGVPPAAPELSNQSTDTISNSASASQASTTGSELDHWAKRVFLDMSTTPLPRTGDS